LKIGARDAADAAVAQKRDLVGRATHQRIVDADRAVFIDDDGSGTAFRRREEAPYQGGLAGPQEARDDRDRQARAARAFLPPPERAEVAGGKQVERGQKSISRM
jgi:hypothetical protein